MTTAAKILKADGRNSIAQRVRLSDLAKPTHSRFAASDFELLQLPTDTTIAPEPVADDRIDSALAALHSAVDQLQAQRDHWLDHCQQETVRLGIAIAERLLRRTLTVHPDAVTDLVRSALEWSVSTDRLQVRLHPTDAELVATQPFDANRTIEFLPDNSLARGDCVIESPNGQTDARIDVILERIADELLMP